MTASLIELMLRSAMANPLWAVAGLAVSLAAAWCVVWGSGRCWNRKWVETHACLVLTVVATVVFFLTFRVCFNGGIRNALDDAECPAKLLCEGEFSSAYKEAKKAAGGGSREPSALEQAKILAGELMASRDTLLPVKALPFMNEDFTAQGQAWHDLESFLRLHPNARPLGSSPDVQFLQDATTVCWQARRTCQRRIFQRGLDAARQAAPLSFLVEFALIFAVCGVCAVADIKVVEPVKPGSPANRKSMHR